MYAYIKLKVHYKHNLWPGVFISIPASSYGLWRVKKPLDSPSVFFLKKQTKGQNSV